MEKSFEAFRRANRAILGDDGERLFDVARTRQRLGDVFLGQIEKLMTPLERRNPLTVDPSKMETIAQVVGCSLDDVLDAFDVYEFMLGCHADYRRLAVQNRLGEWAVFVVLFAPIVCLLIFLALLVYFLAS